MPNDSSQAHAVSAGRAGRTGRTVRLVDVPLDLYGLAQQHTDDLLRELVLMAAHEWAGGEEDGVAAALARRADGHRDRRLELAVAAAPAVDAARARGDSHTTLTYTVPESAAASLEEWGRLLDDLEDLCQDGTLLTVPGSDEVTLFSRWFCLEFVGQLRDRRPPCPWPHYARQAAVERRVPASRTGRTS